MHCAHQHRPELDGLRGAAAWIVVLSHVSAQTLLWNQTFGMGGGQLGVMLFFVLSGYLMGAIYLDRPLNLVTLREYAVHRVARVIPLYYGLVLLSFLMMLTIGMAPYAITPDNIVSHLAIISGISVFWTIPIEIHFYVLFVCCWWLYRWSPPSLIVLAIAGILTCFLVQQPEVKEWAGGLSFYLAYFLAGMLVSRLPRLEMPNLHWSALFLVLAAIFFLSSPGLYVRAFNQQRWLAQDNLLQIWHDPLYLACAAGILLTALYSPVAKVVLGNRVMKHSGDISYSIYLLHMPVIWMLRWSDWLTAHATVFLITAVIATAALASASFRFIEVPARRAIRSRWERSSHDRAVVQENPAP